MGDNNLIPANNGPEAFTRHLLTTLLVSISLLGIVAMSITVILSSKDDQRPDTVKYVFAAVLPMIATWVGTVMAYYFSKSVFGKCHRVNYNVKVVPG